MDLSIIIPCYNSGAYLQEAVDSVLAYTGPHQYEIIIVDDGSKDTATLQLLDQISKKGARVVYQENKGPAGARNTGVKAATSDYILFLDSDNKILANEFIDKGIAFLKANSNTGVFYGDPVFFGKIVNARFFPTADFNFKLMLGVNYIDMCSMVRKKVWVEVGGFDETRILIGHEDWDFWLRIGKTSWQFHYAKLPLYQYRVRQDSLMGGPVDVKEYQKMVQYVLQKHIDVLPLCTYELSGELSALKAVRNQEISRPFRTFVKYLLIKTRLKKNLN